MSKRRKLNFNIARRRNKSKPSSGTANSVYITVIGGILTAVISAGVSYLVASEKLKSDASIRRATLFKELISSLQADPSDPYPLLSLWKIYPDDHRLIVITALQEPTPQTIKLLTQLGYNDELTSFQDDIRRIYESAQGESRETISILFQALDSLEQIDIVLDQLAELDDIPADHPLVSELETLIAVDAKARRQVAGYLAKVPPERNDLRVVLAYALYLAEDKSHFENLLTRVDQNIQSFPVLAAYLRDRQARDIDPRLRSAMIGLASKYSEMVMTQPGTSFISQNFALQSLEQYYSTIARNSVDSEPFRTTLAAIAEHPEARPTQRERSLRMLALNGFEPLAIETYYNIVLCNGARTDQKRAFDTLAFGSTFLADEIAALEYAQARPKLQNDMNERQLSCD